jgi:cytochrome P450
MMGSNLASFPTISSSLHRVRRNGIAPFFSMQAVSRFAPCIQDMVDRLCEKMGECKGKDEVVLLNFAFRAMTADIIARYIFGKGFGLLEREDWGKSFCMAWRDCFMMGALVRQVPWLFDLLKLLPDKVMEWLNPRIVEVLNLERESDFLTEEVLSLDPKEVDEKGQAAIVWKLAHADVLPPQEKTVQRVKAEGYNILGAGFETTGNMLVHLTYNILADKSIHERLIKELEEAIPDPESIPSYQILEKLPFLTAIIKETLR